MEITGALVASSSTPFGICEPKEVSRTRQGGLGGGAEGLSWSRPARHTTYYYQRAFSCLKNFWIFFSFHSPQTIAYCLGLGFCLFAFPLKIT